MNCVFDGVMIWCMSARALSKALFDIYWKTQLNCVFDGVRI